MVVLGHDLKSGEPVSSFDLSYGAYLIGTMGTGKSTVMQRMILDDLDTGRGFILLDPHRQLVETTLSTVPPSYVSNLTVIDMMDNPPGFGINLFDCDDPTDELALSQTAELFVETFRQALTDTSTAWGTLLDSLLYSIAYLVAANPGIGLPDIPKVLREDRYRAALLTQVTNEIVLDYWEGEYAEMSERSRAREIGSTMRRLRSFITNPILNQIFRVPKTTIDFRWLMDEGPGLLVALDPNQPHASNLIGALILAKIKRHTFERKERAENRPFRVYADEFQKFTTTDFDRFWGESRKFNVGVIAAHQFRNQLSPELRSASASVGTRIVFTVNHEDASDLGRMFTLPKTLGEPEFKPVMEEIIEPATMEWYWDPPEAETDLARVKAELAEKAGWRSSILHGLGRLPADKSLNEMLAIPEYHRLFDPLWLRWGKFEVAEKYRSRPLLEPALVEVEPKASNQYSVFLDQAIGRRTGDDYTFYPVGYECLLRIIHATLELFPERQQKTMMVRLGKGAGYLVETYPHAVRWLWQQLQTLPSEAELAELTQQVVELQACRKERVAVPERVISQRYKKEYRDGRQQTIYDWQQTEHRMTAGEFARHLASQPPFQAYVKTNLGQWEIKTIPPPPRTGVDPTSISRQSWALFAPRSQPVRSDVRISVDPPRTRIDQEEVFDDRPRPPIIKRRPDS